MKGVKYLKDPLNRQIHTPTIKGLNLSHAKEVDELNELKTTYGTSGKDKDIAFAQRQLNAIKNGTKANKALLNQISPAFKKEMENNASQETALLKELARQKNIAQQKTFLEDELTQETKLTQEITKQDNIIKQKRYLEDDQQFQQIRLDELKMQNTILQEKQALVD